MATPNLDCSLRAHSGGSYLPHWALGRLQDSLLLPAAACWDLSSFALTLLMCTVCSGYWVCLVLQDRYRHSLG